MRVLGLDVEPRVGGVGQLFFVDFYAVDKQRALAILEYELVILPQPPVVDLFSKPRLFQRLANGCSPETKPVVARIVCDRGIADTNFPPTEGRFLQVDLEIAAERNTEVETVIRIAWEVFDFASANRHAAGATPWLRSTARR